MPFRRTRGSRIFTQRTRRGTFWGRSPADTDTFDLAGSTAVLDSTAVPVVEGETIIRMRGQILVGSDQKVATEPWTGAVGALVASDQAVAVGVGSLPTPYTDQDSDLWFMHQFWGGVFRHNSSVGTEAQVLSRFEFDSKAMRKMMTGTTLCIIAKKYHASFSA